MKFRVSVLLIGISIVSGCQTATPDCDKRLANQQPGGRCCTADAPCIQDRGEPDSRPDRTRDPRGGRPGRI